MLTFLFEKISFICPSFMHFSTTSLIFDIHFWYSTLPCPFKLYHQYFFSLNKTTNQNNGTYFVANAFCGIIQVCTNSFEFVPTTPIFHEIPRQRAHVPRFDHVALLDQRQAAAHAQTSHRKRSRHHCLPRGRLVALLAKDHPITVSAHIHRRARHQPQHASYSIQVSPVRLVFHI